MDPGLRPQIGRKKGPRPPEGVRAAAGGVGRAADEEEEAEGLPCRTNPKALAARWVRVIEGLAIPPLSLSCMHESRAAQGGESAPCGMWP